MSRRAHAAETFSEEGLRDLKSYIALIKPTLLGVPSFKEGSRNTNAEPRGQGSGS